MNSFEVSYETNLVFSPLSIHVLLAMTAAGSTGPTRQQILGFLKSNSSEDLHAHFSWIISKLLIDASTLGRPILSCANGLWLNHDLHLKPGYRDLIQDSYRADIEHVDFQKKADEVRKEVNAWAKKETKGLIKEMLRPSSVQATTRFILANAVYFKGTWETEFDPESTQDMDFYLSDGSSVRAPFMSRYGEEQYFLARDGFKVLKMPYKKGEDKRLFSMHIFLPDTKDGLPALAERVCSDGFIDNHNPHDKVDLAVFRIPKFKIEFRFDTSLFLEKLGFELDGELTEMVDSCFPLNVSGIHHVAFIECNEEGTEAAAVSFEEDIGCCLNYEPPVKPSFVADHPFLFVIREESSNAVLFIGQLINPIDA